ncbi:hypothetical protein D918_02309 [Trichuris suis]|nr:hypothetical protein D918_02309 [Trichuris suis]
MEGSLTKTDEFSLLPSNLLDSHLMAASAPEIDNSEAPQKETLPVDERKQRNWSELFADLDPLHNSADMDTEHL